jgi:hypothetical protein
LLSLSSACLSLRWPSSFSLSLSLIILTFASHGFFLKFFPSFFSFSCSLFLSLFFSE